jgi:uncharacterized protein
LWFGPIEARRAPSEPTISAKLNPMSWLKLDLGEKFTSIALTQVEIMLLEFTVENYRSIKEPVTLSAVAQKAPKRKSSAKTKRGVKSDAEICPGFPVEGWDMELLPVMAIFGANASGKSNVVQSLDYLLMLMGGKEPWRNTYAPFGLEEKSRCNPTKFDLHIFKDGLTYHYHLEIFGKKIHEEALDCSSSKTKRTRQLFRRKWSHDLSDYIWKNGELFAGPHTQLEESVSENELFINLINRLKVKITEPFTEFIRNYLTGLTFMPTESVNRIFANLMRAAGDDDAEDVIAIKKNIVSLLQKFDVGISDLEFRKQSNTKDPGIYAIHETKDGEKISWRFEEESLGTQSLFSFGCSIIVILIEGGLVMFDEFGANIHPKITAYIIELFQNPKTNPKGAQLIFTSHDNTLQRNQLLRRDQIWFTEKRPDQSTDLYSLADFKVRNDLAIDKAYLDGRFGAVPFLPETVEELLGVD